MLKKILGIIICIIFLTSPLFAITSSEMQNYMNKTVYITTQFFNLGERTPYIGKIIDLYEIKEGMSYCYVIALMKINKNVEIIKINTIEHIKVLNPEDLE